MNRCGCGARRADAVDAVNGRDWLASCRSEGETRLKICDQLPDNRLLELK